MKRKKIYDPSNGTRQEWIESAESEIKDLRDNIEELGLPPEIREQIDKIIENFKQELNTQIRSFSITAEIVMNDDNNKEIMDDILWDMWLGKIPVSDYQIDKMIDITSKEGVFIKTSSLVEEMKIETFLEEMKSNPYQLKLIS